MPDDLEEPPLDDRPPPAPPAAARDVVPDLLLAREEQLDLEARVREEPGEADELGGEVRELPVPGRASASQDAAARVDLDHPAVDCDGMHEPDPSAARQEPDELRPHAREPARLDLDQQVAADEVDDPAVDGHLRVVAGLRVPRPQRGVQGTLAQRSDPRRAHRRILPVPRRVQGRLKWRQAAPTP